ncbi:MAG: GIY-YIG nuclease family protein [Candidatus Magasanikbacteria bacterium]|jgi:putative endonuclease|nr:GIY-YIG nuclease family protein [Candidatus Magasanikbacteria bacterium]
MYYVYILECSNGDLYTGFSGNLKKRFQEHKNGLNKSTKPFLHVRLVYYCAFQNEKIAIAFEKYLKSNSGRSFRNKHLIVK